MGSCHNGVFAAEHLNRQLSAFRVAQHRDTLGFGTSSGLHGLLLVQTYSLTIHDPAGESPTGDLLRVPDGKGCEV